jgi:4-amino-4-deoxy-L-arabinose transferase-like glycosyltransferase
MDASGQETRSLNRRTEVIVLLAILLVAAAFRLVQLGEIPPGLTHDEADHGMDAVAILNGARPIYETVGYGREPLYDYVVAALMPVFGQSYLALRLTSALAGLLLIVVMHLWVRRAFDAPTALLTSALLAVSFWVISTDRQALRSALLPVLFSASIFFAWRALSASGTVPASGTPSAPGVSASGELSASSATSIHAIRLPSPSFCGGARIRVRWLNYGAAGLFLGLSLYTYMAARVLPGVYVLLWFYLLVFHRQVWKQNWLGVIVVVALGVGLSLPMFAYLAANPGSEARLSQLSGPIDRLFAGNPSDIFNSALGALGMFTLRGDDLWLYNIPGRPLLDWVTGILFFLGLFIAVRRFRRIEYALALFWLLAGIFPSLLTGVTASSLRSIAAQPVVYLLVAVGAVEAMRWLGRRGAPRAARALPVIILLVAIAVRTAYDYFVVWGQARDVRVAYHTTLFEIARYLDRETEPNAVVAISSIYPGRYHDPSSMAMTLNREDISPRWFTGSFVDVFGVPHASLVFPNGKGNPVWVIAQAVAPVDAAFAGLFATHAERIDAIDLRPDDFNPRFEVYRFDAERAVREALESATRLPGSASFDGALRLLAYDIRTPQASPGDTVEVITYWQFTSPVPFAKQAVVFTHLLTGDPGRPVLAQQDSLDVPLESLAPGDVFAQVHRFVIPPGAPSGAYPLEVGVYAREDGVRLPVSDETGSVMGDHVIIGSIDIVVP